MQCPGHGGEGWGPGTPPHGQQDNTHRAGGGGGFGKGHCVWLYPPPCTVTSNGTEGHARTLSPCTSAACGGGGGGQGDAQQWGTRPFSTAADILCSAGLPETGG